MPSKKLLRETLLQQRKLLPTSIQNQKSSQLCDRLEHDPIFTNSQSIAFYWPAQGEISPIALLERYHAQKNCYLPVLQNTETTLRFVRYDPKHPLVKNKFNIPEPINQQDEISPEKLDLVLTPLVAFSKIGQRLGMGKAYYDQTFAFLKNTTQPKPQLVGLAYAFQGLDTLPEDPWDLRLHKIVTEHDILTPTG